MIKKNKASKKVKKAVKKSVKLVKATKSVKLPSRAAAQPKVKNLKPKSFFKKYEDLLINRKRALLQQFSNVQSEALGKTRLDASGDNSSTPTHMADIASDNFEQELSLNLLESENKELEEINEALLQIKDGTYGLCENCTKPIPEARLKAIPFAHLCLECKKLEEVK